MSNYLIKIPIGDWSSDGHGQCRIFEINSNQPVNKLQEAYKASCKLTGVQFNHNENYTDIKLDMFRDKERLICTDYEDNNISEFAQVVLRKHGITLEEIIDEDECLDEVSFVKLLLAFIGLSMPSDWEWGFIKKEGEYLNGFWNKNLNVQFGYGLFD